LRVEGSEALVRPRCHGPDRVSFGAQACDSNGVGGAGHELGVPASAVGCRVVGVEDPALSAFAGPLSSQVVGGLVGVVGDDVDVGGAGGAAEGDVGEFSAATVAEDVAGVRGGALGAVDGHGVGVVEAIEGQSVAVEADVAAVVHAGGEAVVVDGGDRATLPGLPRGRRGSALPSGVRPVARPC